MVSGITSLSEPTCFAGNFLRRRVGLRLGSSLGSMDWEAAVSFGLGPNNSAAPGRSFVGRGGHAAYGGDKFSHLNRGIACCCWTPPDIGASVLVPGITGTFASVVTIAGLATCVLPDGTSFDPSNAVAAWHSSSEEQRVSTGPPQFLGDPEPSCSKAVSIF